MCPQDVTCVISHHHSSGALIHGLDLLSKARQIVWPMCNRIV